MAKPLTRARAWTCAAINQLAFPGVGTVLGGRRSGYLQAILMLAGFFLTIGFMLRFMTALVLFMAQPEWTEEQFRALYHNVWVGLIGCILCLISWFWALASSIAMLRSASTSPPLPEAAAKDPFNEVSR